MAFLYRYLRLRLGQAGLLPTSKTALAACYLLAMDLLLFMLEKILGLFKPSYGDGLQGWVTFLTLIVIVLFGILAFRWVRAKMLWRLRNRLIVTYVFIGVIPIVLLVGLAIGAFYLFAGQFATFIVTTGLNSELAKLDAANSAIAHQLAARIERGAEAEMAATESARRASKRWADRQICVWLDQKLILNSSATGATVSCPAMPGYVKDSFHQIVRDHDQLHLRAVETVSINAQSLTVLSSEPFDQRLLQDLAANLGEITLYEGLSRKVQPSAGSSNASITVSPQGTSNQGITVDDGKGDRYVLDTTQATPVLTAGSVPPPTRSLDFLAKFATAMYVVNWETGDTSSPAALSVQTRVSKLYEQLFAAQGDFAPAAEIVLLVALVFFAVTEIVALVIGTRLTRTVTGAVAQLYDGTQHVNRGDFSHRISVKSHDQIATLASSFNSMSSSLEKLMEEQKEKQRLENELVIAQEVQEQLFPREASQLASLEVHGFCRPARTVSGDYYDFLKLESDNLMLAVGDISGKGISAALLMATIHSAVRAYSLQDIPVLREPVAAGVALNSGMVLASGLAQTELSPGLLLALLNHQLYQSTPQAKYATLFLGIYHGEQRKLTYSNGGHLPPIVMSTDGTIRRLESGGMVVGLFDDQSYQEGSVQLGSGDIFLAYSDGVTEPENDYGEFGEERLIDLLRENRELPVERITEIITAAVDDWIGANEQPDDITLVLARAR